MAFGALFGFRDMEGDGLYDDNLCITMQCFSR